MFVGRNNAEVLSKGGGIFGGFDGAKAVLKEALMEAPIIFHVVVVRVVEGLVKNVGVYVEDRDCGGLVVEYIVVDEHLGEFVWADVLFIIERDKAFFDSEEGGIET